jgi:hypothetical protein
MWFVNINILGFEKTFILTELMVHWIYALTLTDTTSLVVEEKDLYRVSLKIEKLMNFSLPKKTEKKGFTKDII